MSDFISVEMVIPTLCWASTLDAFHRQGWSVRDLNHTTQMGNGIVGRDVEVWIPDDQIDSHDQCDHDFVFGGKEGDKR